MVHRAHEQPVYDRRVLAGADGVSCRRGPCKCFFFFPKSFVGLFIKDEETVRMGVEILRGRCFSLPFMMIGYHVVNYMNAVNKYNGFDQAGSNI